MVNVCVAAADPFFIVVVGHAADAVVTVAVAVAVNLAMTLACVFFGARLRLAIGCHILDLALAAAAAAPPTAVGLVTTAACWLARTCLRSCLRKLPQVALL
jgi:phosphate/sulfate permease